MKNYALGYKCFSFAYAYDNIIFILEFLMTCQEIYLNINIERMASLFSGLCCWNENDIANNKKMLKFKPHDALNSVQKTMLKFDPVMHLKV